MLTTAWIHRSGVTFSEMERVEAIVSEVERAIIDRYSSHPFRDKGRFLVNVVALRMLDIM